MAKVLYDAWQGGWDGGSRREALASLTAPSAALARTSCFLFTLLSVLSVSVPRIVSQLYPVLVVQENTGRAGRNRPASFPNQSPPENENNLLTNCSCPPSRGRKFQVTVRASPTGAKLEKVHFNRTSVPLTASSTRAV